MICFFAYDMLLCLSYASLPTICFFAYDMLLCLSYASLPIICFFAYHMLLCLWYASLSIICFFAYDMLLCLWYASLTTIRFMDAILISIQRLIPYASIIFHRNLRSSHPPTLTLTTTFKHLPLLFSQKCNTSQKNRLSVQFQVMWICVWCPKLP